MDSFQITSLLVGDFVISLHMKAEFAARLIVVGLVAVPSTLGALQGPAYRLSHRAVVGCAHQPQSRGSAITCAERSHGTLTLVRHGQSEWNLANRFTGWVDVDLTARGIAEAREAGRVLKDDATFEGYDLVVTSSLRRAVRTSCLVLSAVGSCWVPMLKDSRLNEQHSGALTGRNKRALAKEYGQEQVMRWRRGFAQPPPPISVVAPLQRTMCQDERYRRQPCDRGTRPRQDVVVPRGEAFCDCLERVRECLRDTITPALSSGKNVLVVSHGNTLRALIKLIEQVSDEDAFHLDMPTACPLVYRVGCDGAKVGAPQGVWGSSNVERYGRFLYDQQRVEQAQQIMRSQVLRNVAVSTISSSDDSSAIATCDAWSEAGVTSRKVSVGDDAESFNVRTLGAPTRQPQAEPAELEVGSDGKEGGTEAVITTITTPPRRNPRYEGVGGPAASSLELGAQASRELAIFARRRRQVSGGAPDASEEGRQARCSLILIRHGYSEWNAENKFTGWADPPLTARGREEARLAGSLLREAGVGRIERVYCSLHERAIKTAWLLLDEMELQWVPLSYVWQLNERHYGKLTGRNKRECSEEYGLEQVQRWRRSVHEAPPPMDASAAEALLDERYCDVPAPSTESLAQCAERLRPFLRGELTQTMQRVVDNCGALAELDGSALEVPTFVISSSENVLRAMVRELEGLSDAETALIDVPHATPLVYRLDAQLEPIPSGLAQLPLRMGWYMADPDRIAKVQKTIRNEVDCRLNDTPCEVDPQPSGVEGCFVPPPNPEGELADVSGAAWACDEGAAKGA